MKAVKRRATYDDLAAVPEHLVAEIIDGELYTSPRPASPHARAASKLGSELIGGFDPPPGGAGDREAWWLLFEPELHLDADTVVPDVAGWRRDRMPVLPNVVAFTQAPDWICEVVSPSTGVLDRSRKMAVYARVGVAHLWIVDPLAKTLEAYRLEGGRWVVIGAHGAGDVVRAEPFSGLALDLSRLWLTE